MVNDNQRVKDFQEFLYSCTSLLLSSNVDEALYEIVWYGPLIVAVFILLPIYMCFDHGLEGNYSMNVYW